MIVEDFTPEQRLEIYRLAVTQQRYNSGLCSNLWNAAKHLYNYEGPTVSDRFPEVFEQKPLVTWNSTFWFKPGDAMPRLKVLYKAIAEVKLLCNK